jgi:hypothetical protein
MLYKFDVLNQQGATTTFQFDDTSAGFELRDIDGLDPVKATLSSASFAQLDGEQYHSSKRGKRNLMMKIGLEPDFVDVSVKDLRDQLYSYFMPKSQVTLTFYDDDGPTVYILGRVEDCVCPLFVSEPEANISILCFDSDFKDTGDVSLSGNSVADTTETLVTYEGSVDTGIVFTFLPDRAVSAFTVYHRKPDGSSLQQDFSISLVADDSLVVSNIPGQKSVMLTRSSVTTSVLYAKATQSGWIELAPGDNYIRVFAEGAPIPYTIEYTNRYGGL